MAPEDRETSQSQRAARRLRSPVRARLRYGCLVAALAIVACSGPQTAGPSAVAEQQSPIPAAGAERWSGSALLLPVDSPLVLEARIDAVLTAIARFKEWVIAEPRMLGENGESTVQMIELGWRAIVHHINLDPLDAGAWEEFGIDVSRTMYVGLHPLDDAGLQFVRSTDATLRDELGVPPGRPIGPALRDLVATAGALPEGANARVLRAVADARPRAGLRAIIPITLPGRFLDTAGIFADSLGFEALGPEESSALGVGSRGRGYVSTSVVPGFAVRIEGSYAVVDVLTPTLLGGQASGEGVEARERTMSGLRDLVGRAAGRPSAPRAPGMPALALSVEQRAGASVVRLRGYQNSLGELSSASTERRDELLLQGLLRTLAASEAWSVASEELPGTSYALSLPSADAHDAGSFSVTTFARRDMPELPPPSRHPSLGVQDRSAAIALSAASMYTPGWQEWFLGDTPGALSRLEPAMFDRREFLLPAIRNLPLLLGVSGDAGAVKELSPTAYEGIADIYGVEHLEVATLDAAFGAGEPPRMLVEAVIDSTDDVEARAVAVRDYVLAVLLHVNDRAEEALPRMPSPHIGRAEVVSIEGLPIVRYRLAERRENHVLLVGVGVDEPRFESELAATADVESEPLVLSARLEPVALVSWLRDEDEPFESLDVDILAQRLGPVLIRVGPEEIGETNAMNLEVVLEHPPKL